MESLRFSTYKIMSPDNYTFSFPILMPFISFSWLIAVAKAPSTGENGQTCLFPHLRGKAFNSDSSGIYSACWDCFIFSIVLVMHSSFYLRFSCACSLIYLQQSWKKERTCFSWVYTSSLCVGVCVLFSSFFFSTGSICLPHWSQCLHSLLWLIRTSLRHGVGGHWLSYLKVKHILHLVLCNI